VRNAGMALLIHAYGAEPASIDHIPGNCARDQGTPLSQMGWQFIGQLRRFTMKKTQLAFAALVAAGLVAAPFAAEAKSHKTKHHSMSSQTTTGANMRSGGSANPSSQGNVGPGTNQAGSMSTPK
jgi:hypothetical protein